MRIKTFLSAAVLCALLLAGCETRTSENSQANLNAGATPPNLNTGRDERNQADHSNQQGHAPANENSAGGTGSEADEKADFEGTAGIIHKDNKVSGVAILREVRSAGHPAYDRVVFEFEGAEMPGYHIEYIDKPVRQCGSGHTVPLKGDGWLQVRFTPAHAHTEDGKPTVKDRERSPNHKIIKELKLTCDFEADVTWVLGVASPNRYRVLELKNPTRLAIDIRH